MESAVNDSMVFTLNMVHHFEKCTEIFTSPFVRWVYPVTHSFALTLRIRRLITESIYHREITCVETKSSVVISLTLSRVLGAH